MNFLVDLVATRFWLGALAKGFIFLVLILTVDLWDSTFMGRAPYSLRGDVIPTMVIATPFVILIMAVLHRQQVLQTKLTLLASTDVLTGLLNWREYLIRASEATGGGASKTGNKEPLQTGVLMLLDADHFKRINDTYGHAVGYRCLITIAQHLRANLRQGDIAGRVGGEEFSIFMSDISIEQAGDIGERLCRNIGIDQEGVADGIDVTISIGTVMCDRHTPLDKLMAMADAALYRAKAEGRARMVIWS